MTQPDDWTDLDQAYLEIFGDHPALSAAGGNVVSMRSNVTVYQ